MKRILKRVTSLESALTFFDKDGNLSDVSNLRGDVSNLRGNVSYYLRGDVSNLTGNVSFYLTGDVSYLRGNVSNLTGNVDDAEISEEDRKKGVDVSDLIIAE